MWESRCDGRRSVGAQIRACGQPLESVSRGGRHGRWARNRSVSVRTRLAGLGIGGDALGRCACRRGGRWCGRGRRRRRRWRGGVRVGELARQVHGDLARPGDAGGAAGRESSSTARRRRPRRWRPGSSRMATRRAGPGCRVEAVEDLGGQRRRDRPAGQRVVGDDADQRALERAHVVGRCARRSRSSDRVVGELRCRRARRACAGWSCAWPRSGGAMSATSPDSKRSRSRSSSASRSRGRRSEVRTSWRAGLVEGVEGVEELLLGPGLAREELDVVDEQDVGAAVSVP